MQEVLSKSLGILAANPVLFAPLVITFAIVLLNDILEASRLAPLSILVDVVLFVVVILVCGGYPFMVRAVVNGGKVSITEAFGKAFHRFWTVLAASILVGLIVALGTVALVVPGIILATWYIYTVPAIILEDKGALGGMAASKAFGRDKKWSTFSMYLVVGVAYLVAYILLGIVTLLGSNLLGKVLLDILSIPIGAWAFVIFSYTYITYGPLSAMAAAGTSGFEVGSPTSTQQPGVQAGASWSKNFCSSCGSSLRPGAKFCPNCGQPV